MIAEIRGFSKKETTIFIGPIEEEERGGYRRVRRAV
jgi:hypothetical protein